MNPILFSENSTTFTTNGIGRLSSAISCECVEERNGQYEVELTYPIDGQHYSDIGIRKIIVVIPSDGATLQAFRIYKISKPINGKVVINARHISYDLSKNTSMPFSITSSPSACSQALAGLKSHAVETCPFTFWTDVTTAGSYSQSAPASIKSRLGGVEGSVLDQFGGEYEWDNFTVKLHRQRGSLAELNGLTLRYGKNITDITQEENIASTATGAVPYWQDYEGDLVTLPEQAVYSQYASRYSQHLTVPLDLSEKFDDKPTVEALRAAANVVVNASEFGLPKVSIEVSFVALWQTEEYKDIAPLQRVKLCDEVTVSFEKLGVDVTAKVVKTVYDVLAERYQSIQIGSVRSNLAMTLTDQNAQTLRQIEAQAVSVETAINNATKWLTTAGGYVIAIRNADGSWKELIFSNMTDPYDSNAKILRVNNNGIGFSLNGMNGTFRNAWTIDGNLVADFIHGGTLTLGGNNNGNGVMSFVDGNAHEIIRIDRTGAYFYAWTYANGTWTKTIIGSWTPSGIDVKKGLINGAGITLGGSSNASGTLTIKDANGNTIGTWNNGGINVNAGIVALGNKRAIDDGNTGVYIGSGGIGLGAKTGSLTRSPFKVDSDGNLYATSADITGAIKATSGEIGGTGSAKFTIEGNHIKNGKSSLTDASNGIYLGTDGIALGASSKFKVDNQGALTATGVDITGALKATSGEIGSGNSKFTINGNHISNGKSSISDNQNGVYVGTDGISLGANNKFKVDNNGNLNAESATLKGSFRNEGDNNGSVSMNGGILTVHNGGSASGYIKLELGDEELTMNEHEISWKKGEDVFMQSRWSDILAAFPKN